MVRTGSPRANPLVPLLSLVALVVFGLLLWPIARVEELFYPTARAVDGVLTVVEPEFSRSVWSVEGTWAYYPGTLADPVAIVTDPSLPRPQNVPVPWPLKRDSAGRYTPQNLVGTYHLRIEGLTAGGSYGLFLKEVSSGYRAFVDGELVASRDLVGPETALFTARGSAVDLVIQVVDKTTSLGGLWQKVYLGTARGALGLQSLVTQRDLYFLASVMIMALFQWILALVIRRDRATFFLAVFCTAILVKSAFSETMFGFTWFPGLPYETGMVLAYLALILLIPVFLAYTRHCFPGEVWAPLVAVSWLPALVETALVALTPFEWYQSHFLWFQIYLMAGCAVVLAIGILATVRRKEGARLSVLGFLLVFAAGVNDVLFSHQLVQTGYLLNIGLYYFLLVQSAIIALRYRSALAAHEDLSRDLEAKVAARTRELADERNTFERLAQEDSLTGLFNKRHLNAVLDTEFEAFQRYGQALSVLMFDIDWFKRVNDTHGHLCGDRLLADLAGLVRSRLRKTDLCARFGGEEFVVVLRHTRLEEARQAAENLRHAVETTPFEVDGIRLGLTISVGVAEVTAETVNEAALIRKADEALYLAKSTGRNRVVAL